MNEVENVSEKCDHWAIKVVNVEGPSVAMAAPYVAHDAALDRPVTVSVELKGPNALPVTASLTVSQRFLDSGEDVSCSPVLMACLYNDILAIFLAAR